MRSLLMTIAVLSVLAVTGDLKADSPEFVGSKKCKMCHISQYNSWKGTKMALSFEVLKPGQAVEAKKAHGFDPQKDYTSDQECLSCHTTGFGQPGGYVDFEKTPDLAGVGCESCHGPGSEYLQTDLMSLKNKDHSLESVRAAGLIYPVGEESCKSQCHNEKSPFVSKDQAFDFAERKARGVHEPTPLKYKHE